MPDSGSPTARCRSTSARSTPSALIRTAVSRRSEAARGSRICSPPRWPPGSSRRWAAVVTSALRAWRWPAVIRLRRGLFGTACDNVIGAQIVTADGEVLELGPGRNEDLFWAIRGGGGNFGVVTRLDFRLHGVRTFHAATFQFGWSDIADAMRIFGELVRETPDEVRAGFFVDPDTGASARCGFYGDAAAAAAYLARWKAAFRSVEPRMESSMPNPQGEVWATTSLAVDGAFLEGMTGDVVDVLARAAVAARGVGAMLMGLSNGVASRVGMTDTAYPLRGTGLSCLLSAEWKRTQERERAVRWVAEHGAALRPWARRAYVNYLAPSSPERIREVYGVNYAGWLASKQSTTRRICSGRTRIFCLRPAASERLHRVKCAAP